MMRRLMVLCLLVLGSAAFAAAPPAKPLRITMVVFRGCEDACKGFREYWIQHKIPAEIEILDAATDAKKLPGFVARVKQTRPDLLVTWGTTVSLQMLGTNGNVDPAKHVTEIPALFMIASTPVGSKLVPDLTSSGRNISGTLYLVPVDTQLNAARLYLPFKRVGYLANSTENNSAVIQQDLQDAQAKFGYQLVTRNVPLDAAGKPDKASLPRLVEELAADKIDLLYMAPDTFLLLNRDAITQAAVAQKVPVLASAEAAVLEASALLGVVNRYYTVGQLTASKAAQILIDKVAPRDIPIVAPPGFSLIVNMRVAQALALYPPIRVLKIAEIVR